MRILVVSAHYPPDFVSGGTLVPQRLAQGLARRGHDVSVYAGALDRSREPLESWDEVDDEGVSVQWIATYPWIDWSDVRNYDNPPVTSHFAAWAAERRPDVVHLHSLQSLGVGLVEAAADLGARVLVTAHDFFWQCARQFLVDRTGTPCSLVVRAGSCSCEAGREHLDLRNRRTAAALARADVVLAPSAAAAQILAANGVDPDRIRVDANGVPGASAPTPAAPGGTGRGRTPEPIATARLLYAGGPDLMKGWPVLVDAVRTMADVPGWTLTAYGVAGDASARKLPAQVTVLPPYQPDDLSAVLAAHDVLVLPSLARETYSLLTREALAAGLTVVTSDVPGPLEVVGHGRNGLVVPAADPVALAGALSFLARDPAQVARLRGGEPPVIRSLEEQLDGMESLFATMLAAPEPLAGEPMPADPFPGSPPIPLPTPLTRPLGAPQPGAATDRRRTAPPVERVLFIVGIQGAPLRYRVQLPAAGLRTLGREVDVRWYRDPALPQLATLADAVVCYRVPATRQLLDLLTEVTDSDRAIPVVFDVDDLIVDPTLRGRVRGLTGLQQAEQDLWWHGVARYRTTLEASDLYVGSTEALCRRVAELTGMPTRRFANGVGELMGQVSDAALRRPRTPGPVRIGYFSGTTTHDADWAAVEPAVLQVMAHHPDVELWLGGHLRPTPALDAVSGRVRRLPMRPWHELPVLLRDVDVNLAPLHLSTDADADADRFNEAKSAIKWSEAALVATPSVCSPTQPFRELVTHGETGMLPSSPAEWVTCLQTLVSDGAERARIGAAARREALLRLSPDLQARAYLSILEDARRRRTEDGPRRITSGWQPVADDEPWEEVTLEPYALPPAQPQDVPPEPAGVRRLLGRAAEVYRNEGAASVVRRGMAAVRRRL